MTAGDKLTLIEKQKALKAMAGALVSITDNLCQKLLDQDTEGIEMIPESTMDMIEFVHDCCSSNEHDEILNFVQGSDDSDAPKKNIQQRTKLQQCLKEIWRLYSKEFEELKKTVSSEDMLKIEGAEICLHHLDHVFTQGFTLPNDEDYLKIRNPTTHMEKHAGMYNGEKFELIDVGGQTHFQDEWGLIIAGVRSETSCILYVVSLLDYSWNESRLGLESTINRFDRSLETWRQLLNNEAISGRAFKSFHAYIDHYYQPYSHVMLTSCSPHFMLCTRNSYRTPTEQRRYDQNTCNDHKDKLLKSFSSPCFFCNRPVRQPLERIPVVNLSIIPKCF